MRLPDDLANDCLSCLRFFSRLPLPPAAGPEDRLPVAMVPVASFLIGCVPAAVLAATLVLGLPVPLASVIALAALVAVTGAMHEDGLADCADGFGGGWDRARKLAIMRDSRIGTYGCCALVLSLLIRALAVASLTGRSPAAAVAGFVVVAALSRTACLMPLMLLAPARSDGLGAAKARPAPRAFAGAAAICGLVSLVLVPLGIGVVQIVATLALGFGAALFVCWLAERQIGGQTGDVAGAAQQAAEIAALLGLAAG